LIHVKPSAPGRNAAVAGDNAVIGSADPPACDREGDVAPISIDVEYLFTNSDLVHIRFPTPDLG
jgi:hypothetical protein